MKKMIFLVGFAILVSLNFASAQSMIGLRLGYPTSVTYKHFLNESNAIEVYGGFRGYTGYRWFNLSGAYQVHKPLPDVTEGLSWYFGGGASVYFWSFGNDFTGGDFSSTTFGIQGYLGLDYQFADAPVNLSVDWVPTFFLNGFGNGFGAGYGSLAVRYIFSR